MKLKWAKKKIHEMRSSLNVVTNYVEHLTPDDNDEKEYLSATLSSINKLNEAVEDLSRLIDADIQRNKLYKTEVLG